VIPTPIYDELAGALRDRIAVIRDTAWRDRDAAGQLARLQEVSQLIVDLQGRLPAPVDPNLAHYLERCSYDKALAWLEGTRTGGH
jgi:hypothetical protein